MTIHYIITDTIYDGCDQEHEVVDLFENKETAIKRYNDYVDRVKKEWPNNNYEWEENEDSFSAYKDGEYIDYHCNVRLESKELIID